MNATRASVSAPRARAARLLAALFFCLATAGVCLPSASASVMPMEDLAVPTSGSVITANGDPSTLPPVASTITGGDSDAFEITFNFNGFTPQQEETFRTAAAIWDLVITGYQADALFGTPLTFGGGVTGPVITAGTSTADPPFDGPGGVLATGGVSTVTAIDLPDPNATDFVLSTSGAVTFDAADIGMLESSGIFLDVAVHELGHALGIGTLWNTGGISFISQINGQVVSVPDSGEYTGLAGLAAYQSEFDASAQAVPVELAGGPGTANAHWNENLGSGDTSVTLPISNVTGLPISNEILTGQLGGSQLPSFLSTLTARSLEDIGFTVDPAFQSATLADLAALVAIPEPTGAALMATLLLATASYRRRA